MSRKMIAIVLILALAITASMVVAQGRRQRAAGTAPTAGEPCWGHGMDKGFLDKLTSQLNLTPDQITRIKAIHQDFLTSTASTRNQLKTQMQEMVPLWTAEPPDAAAIKAKAAQMDPLRAELRDASIDSAVAALMVLTPGQRAKLRTLIQQNPRFGWMLGASMFGGMGMCPGKGAGKGAPRGAGRGPAAGCCPLAR